MIDDWTVGARLSYARKQRVAETVPSGFAALWPGDAAHRIRPSDLVLSGNDKSSNLAAASSTRLEFTDVGTAEIDEYRTLPVT